MLDVGHGFDAAGVAQLVEQLTCNEQVGGSSPSASSAALEGKSFRSGVGQVAERLKAPDCKSGLVRVRRFESFPAHIVLVI